MSDLTAIAYVSTKAVSVSETEINQLLEKSRLSNKLQEITGLLLYCNGCFMQYLEGPQDKLNQVYQLIKTDNRHYAMIELFNEPVESREFGDWTMGYTEAKEIFLDDLTKANWATETGGEKSTGRKLLSAFWSRNTLRGGARLNFLMPTSPGNT